MWRKVPGNADFIQIHHKMSTLRPYQQEAIDAIYNYCRARDGNPLAVLPTGAGKTRIMCQLANDIVNWSYRPIVISHSPELVEQTHREICEMAPQLRPSIFCNKLRKKDLSGRVVVASVQSLHYQAASIGMFRVAIVDECDTIPNARTTGMYHNVISQLRARDEKLRLIGLTATPYRLDGGMIYGGNGCLFDEVCYEAEITDLINDGYLSPLITRIAKGEVSRAGLKVSGGEFTESSMNEAYTQKRIVAQAAAELMAAMQDRRKCLVFCCSKDHCEMMAEKLPDSAILTYETPDNVRAAVIHGFKSGHIRYLVNINICAVGFNVPDVDCVALLRPTMSKRLYYQQVGRGMRIHPSKSDCLVLDFAGNAKAHGPVNRLAMKVKTDRLVADVGIKRETDEDAVRMCPECRTANEISAIECVECGAALRMTREFSHNAAADTTAVIVDMDKPRDGYEEIKYVECLLHTPRVKNWPESSKCVRIVYHLASGEEISDWKFPEGHRVEPFRQWWMANSKPPVPSNAVEAIARLNSGAVKFPSHVKLNRKGKYPEIIGRRWNGTPQIMQIGIL